MTADRGPPKVEGWPEHVLRAGDHHPSLRDEPKPDEHRESVEPWLSALFQSEHLNLLVGSGLTTAMAEASGTSGVDMAPVRFDCEQAEAVEEAARRSAQRMGRGEANIEDQIRAARELTAGLRVLATVSGRAEGDETLPRRADRILSAWESELDAALTSFTRKVLATERGIEKVLTDTEDGARADHVRWLLGGFILPFASRAATRERLHIFTTNYDRLIEFACDLLGLRVLDRFVGRLAPVFQSSRLGVDLHYNPPGIRGEPRYLEGVVRLTKLHGSVEWRYDLGPSGEHEVQRRSLPFAAPGDHPEIPEHPGENLLVYPNPAKDVETLEYPYAEMFRDFAAAACRPNSVVVTYGYGFGDDHVNRVLRDMLSIPSTHLVVISFDSADGRVSRFCERAARAEQISLLVGPHFGDLATLVEHYLPKPAIDPTMLRMRNLQRARALPEGVENKGEDGEKDAALFGDVP